MAALLGEVALDAGGVRRKRVYALRDLHLLGIETPDLQRSSDASRVDEIVAYQETRQGGPMFVGDLVAAADRGIDGRGKERLWLVDGQHRWQAMRRLAPRFPESVLSIEVVDLSAPGAPTMCELFDVINRAVPVPDYIRVGTLDVQKREALHGLAARVRAAFGPFLSPSRAPRRPNVHLDRLLDRIAASELSDALLVSDGGARAFAYLA